MNGDQMGPPPAGASTAYGLGRLKQVEPLSTWPLEERDFTPWLLDNGDALGAALEIDLELTERKHRVGPFELDLLGRDLTHDTPLIVENQLTSTDHEHLGQLLTYAAGTDAATVVWIAEEFREPHRQTLDWLNERTDEKTRFFGVEIQVVRIGESAPAPNFKVVSAPNDWQKWARHASGGSATQTPRQTLHAQFWAKLIERVAAERPTCTNRKTLEGQTQNRLDLPSPFRHSYYAMSFAQRGTTTPGAVHRPRHSGSERRTLQRSACAKGRDRASVWRTAVLGAAFGQAGLPNRRLHARQGHTDRTTRRVRGLVIATGDRLRQALQPHVD